VELRYYLRAIVRNWWIVAGVTLITVLALYFFRPVGTTYETSATYVVRPRSLVAAESVRATEALNRGVEINATYARIVRSDAVKQRARRQLTSLGISTEGLGVTSEVIPGTNILEIGATGSDPAAVAAYASAVGEAAATYLDDLGEVYLLEELDPPGDPSVLGSNNTLTLLVGMTLGLLAGAVLAFGREYMREPAAPGVQGIWDRDTGLYSDGYFLTRLRQELGRCGVPTDLPTRASSSPPRHNPLFTVGLVALAPGDGSRAAAGIAPLERRDAGQALQARLRPEDILAYVGDDTFAVLFPDLAAARAGEILVGWRDRLAETSGAGSAAKLATVTTCECSSLGLAGHEEIVRLACAR